MTALGVIDTAITSLNANSLAMNRFRSDVLSHLGEVETALALGAEARVSVRPYV